jgi:hypothetical protein
MVSRLTLKVSARTVFFSLAAARRRTSAFWLAVKVGLRLGHFL